MVGENNEYRDEDDWMWIWHTRPRKSDVIGKFQIDYSEPTQAQVDAANAECADLINMSEWISVNRRV